MKLQNQKRLPVPVTLTCCRKRRYPPPRRGNSRQARVAGREARRMVNMRPIAPCRHRAHSLPPFPPPCLSPRLFTPSFPPFCTPLRALAVPNPPSLYPLFTPPISAPHSKPDPWQPAPPRALSMQKSAMGRERIESPVSATTPPKRRSPMPPIGPGRGGEWEGGAYCRVLARAHEMQTSDRDRAQPPFLPICYTRGGVSTCPRLARRVPAL